MHPTIYPLCMHPLLPTDRKRRSGKRQVHSKEQQQEDAADSLAEQTALAMPEVRN